MNTKVTVGPSTILGAGVSTSAFIAAVLAFIYGDHSQQVVGTLTGGAVSALLLTVTLVGRYAQAHAQTVAAATVTPDSVHDEVPGLSEGVKADGPVEGSDG